jgi:hypothetical protein
MMMLPPSYLQGQKALEPFWKKRKGSSGISSSSTAAEFSWFRVQGLRLGE